VKYISAIEIIPASSPMLQVSERKYTGFKEAEAQGQI